MKVWSLLILALVISCSSQPSKKVENDVDTYINQWKQDYEADAAYAEKYRSYLQTVKTLYIENDIEPKFKLYMSSLNNMNQLLGHAEYNMPYKFKKERGRYANPNLKEYKNYLASNLAYTKRKLANERKLKIRMDVGAEFYQKLQSNLEEFSKQHPGEEFPL